ncbi:Deoxyribose-phosphate aldolase [hydrothermal vent metagenome]|uniref:deoxyribose-phosphate aldolase n=1 Tax=hydrothermal vent metagenome TaxID=652676 RepID=A0A3B1E5U6_9ZZZZ
MPDSPTLPTLPPSPTVDAVAAAQRAASFATRSIKKSTKLAGLRLALSMTDLTTLEGKDSPEKVRSLCRKAIRPFERDEELLGERLPHVAAVCVYPSMVAVTREALDTGRGLSGPTGGRDAHPTDAQEGGLSSPQSIPKVASVATGFPSGQYPLSVRLRDTEQAIADGADEIDMVINRGAFLSGKYDIVAEEIREVAAVCSGAGVSPASVHLKVILETGELETLDNVRRASDIAIANIRDGDFIKTSTGKVSPAATMPVTLVMLEAIRDEYLRTGRHIGMKPAGGIRTAKQSLHYLVMVQETLGHLPGHEGCPWLSPDLFRFGASSLVNDILRQLVKQKTGHYTAAYDFSEA